MNAVVCEKIQNEINSQILKNQKVKKIVKRVSYYATLDQKYAVDVSKFKMNNKKSKKN